MLASNEPYRTPSSVTPSVHAALDALVGRMMARKANERFLDGVACADALAEWQWTNRGPVSEQALSAWLKSLDSAGAATLPAVPPVQLPQSGSEASARAVVNATVVANPDDAARRNVGSDASARAAPGSATTSPDVATRRNVGSDASARAAPSSATTSPDVAARRNAGSNASARAALSATVMASPDDVVRRKGNADAEAPVTSDKGSTRRSDGANAAAPAAAISSTVVTRPEEPARRNPGSDAAATAAAIRSTVMRPEGLARRNPGSDAAAPARPEGSSHAAPVTSTVVASPAAEARRAAGSDAATHAAPVSPTGVQGPSSSNVTRAAPPTTTATLILSESAPVTAPRPTAPQTPHADPPGVPERRRWTWLALGVCVVGSSRLERSWPHATRRQTLRWDWWLLHHLSRSRQHLHPRRDQWLLHSPSCSLHRRPNLRRSSCGCPRRPTQRRSRSMGCSSVTRLSS